MCRCRYLVAALTLVLIGAATAHSQSKGSPPSTKQAAASGAPVTYCELLEHAEKYENQVVRVDAMYETDFEKSVITSQACPTPVPMIWVNFDEHWESRTTRKVRKTVSDLKWRVPLNVVFIGRFKTDGHFGHMDMYPLLIEVLRVVSASAPKKVQASPKP